MAADSFVNDLGADETGMDPASVEKEMTIAPPRRIQSLVVKIHVPHDLSSENKEKLERAAHTCPVHRSLHPDVQTPFEFTWG